MSEGSEKPQATPERVDEQESSNDADDLELLEWLEKVADTDGWTIEE